MLFRLICSIQMEAQNAIVGASLQSAIPTIKIPKNHLFSRAFRINSPNPKWVSPKTRSFASQTLLAKRSVHCRNSIDKVESEGVPESDIGDDEPKAKLRRKNLAVFVSGGGSNFRSIYEATLNGSVHGDVVVLVTNKQGKDFIFNPYLSALFYDYFVGFCNWPKLSALLQLMAFWSLISVHIS